MPGFRLFLKYWLPVLIWMLMIFSASTDAMSTRRTSRIIGPLLRWLKPDISEAAIYRVQYVARKGAHMTEYAVLALLLWRARRKPARQDLRPWRWAQAGFAFGLAALYAASDEFHQSWVPSREGRVADVFLDVAGAGLGLLAFWAIGRWRKFW